MINTPIYEPGKPCAACEDSCNDGLCMNHKKITVLYRGNFDHKFLINFWKFFENFKIFT